MKNHPIRRFTLSASVLAAIACGTNLPAAGWSSIHGNNRSSGAPSRPAPPSAPRSQPSGHESRPEARPSEQRPQNNQVREQPRNVGRAPDHQEELNRARSGQADRRRMDIDEDRRGSFFWGGFHPGMRIGRLPDGYRRIGVRGHFFYYYEGVYYDDGPSGYVVVDPPLNAVLSELPPGAETVVLGDAVYYYAGGAFYQQQADGGFVLVTAPLGVTVTLLPTDAVSTVINGTVYYQASGTFYLPVMQNGVTAFLTVPRP